MEAVAGPQGEQLDDLPGAAPSPRLLGNGHTAELGVEAAEQRNA